jgi:hypothetical protein
VTELNPEEPEGLAHAAHWYAQHGIPVFPCRPREKKPFTRHGFNDATVDQRRISEWWRKWPNANIGIPTGAVSGLLVVDCDPRNGGPAERGELIQQYGPVPETAEASTGGGGRHLFFRYGGGAVPKALAKGIDLKGDGGYVLVAPSVHPSGSLYQWDGIEGPKALLHPGEVPPWLLEQIRTVRKDPARQEGTSDGVSRSTCNTPASVAISHSASEKLLEGRRNNELCRYAGSLRARGFEPPQILQALREANERWCIPSLPDSELRNMAKQSAKWKSGQPVQRAPSVPDGCFDPRPAVCGFSPAAIVAADKTMRLRRRAVALYAFLAELFGPYGCHPSQESIGKALAIAQQHVARHVAYLVRAGLIRVEAGAYREAEKKFACNSYHFVRHPIFAAHFTRRGLPVFNGVADFSHHFQLENSGLAPHVEGAIRRLTQNQQLTENLTPRCVVEPISQCGGSLSADIEGSAQPAVINALQCAPDTKGYWITRYVECARSCGGCRIEYGDGTVKQYGCSCEINPVLLLMEKVRVHRLAMRRGNRELEESAA